MDNVVNGKLSFTFQAVKTGYFIKGLFRNDATAGPNEYKGEAATHFQSGYRAHIITEVIALVNIYILHILK